MYNNGFYNPTASAAKAIVAFLLVILVGASVLFVLASGNLGPEAEARAQRIRVETQINEAKQRLGLAYQDKDYQQKLEQNARDFEQWQMLKDWGARVAFAGLALAAIILAAGKSVQWIRQVQIQTPPRQVVQPTASEATRLRNMYALLEQMNNRLGQMDRQIANTQTQVMATQQQLEQIRAHDNGSDPSNNIIPFERRA